MIATFDFANAKLAFTNAQHSVCFRSVRITPELADALKATGVGLYLSFAEIDGVNTLQLDLAETTRPRT